MCIDKFYSHNPIACVGKLYLFFNFPAPINWKLAKQATSFSLTCKTFLVSAFSCMDNVNINSRGYKFHFYFMIWRANRIKGSQGSWRGTLWQIKTVDYKRAMVMFDIIPYCSIYIFLNKLGKGQIIWWEHFWQTSRSKNKH